MARNRRKKLPREPITAMTASLSHDGRGVAHIEGKTVFVDGALAGETVSFKYTNRNNRFDEGRVIEVLEAARERVEPACAHADICGGCSLQHLEPRSQIALKQSVLLEQLQHFGGIAPEQLLPPMTGPVQAYRRKARLAVKFVPKKGGGMVGFREKRSPYVADITGCTVLVPEVGGIIAHLRELVGGLEACRTIPQIEVAQGDDATALVFRHLQPLSANDKVKLSEFCRERQLHLYLQPGGNDSVHRVWPESGEERLVYLLPEFGLEMRFHPMDFIQVNPVINQYMVRQVVQFLELSAQDNVLDLFSGLGNFTLPLATKAARVVGVEGGAAMVARGQENAKHNLLNNIKFYEADLTKTLAGQPWARGGFNKILIDPPRSGALEIISNITMFSPERIIYVSCNPATLARDAGELDRLGYRLKKAGVMDMFPHTTHVESIAVFEPG